MDIYIYIHNGDISETIYVYLYIYVYIYVYICMNGISNGLYYILYGYTGTITNGYFIDMNGYRQHIWMGEL